MTKEIKLETRRETLLKLERETLCGTPALG